MDSTEMANLSLTDPFTQIITLHLADGTPLEVPLVELDEFMLYSVRMCINYASQIGASLVLLVILLLLTKPEKRRAPIFITNVLSLALVFIRNILQCLYFTGPFNNLYAYYGQDYSRVTGKDYGTSVATTVMTLLLLICVELSLLLQIRVVCCTLSKLHRTLTYTTSILVATIAVAFRLALCIENSKAIVSWTYVSNVEWLVNASNATTSISICWFCAAFVTKLGFALRQRRQLGLDRFGPMQIIFIMGCQTLVIPAIFSILPYVIKVPGFSSHVLTLVSIFLPLSSLWASASISNRTQPPNGMNLRQELFKNSATGSSGPLVDGKNFHGPLSPTNTARSMTSNTTLISPGNHDYHDIVGRDLEAQGLKEGHKA